VDPSLDLLPNPLPNPIEILVSYDFLMQLMVLIYNFSWPNMVVAKGPSGSWSFQYEELNEMFIKVIIQEIPYMHFT
jgi:hypothetical protein